MNGSVHICDDPVAADWGLGPLPPKRGRLTLIGWHHIADPEDGNVPPPLFRALAAAMAGVARVTFLSSEHSAAQGRAAGPLWSHVEGDEVRAIPPDGWRDQVRAMRGLMPATIVQVSTVRASIAVRFFNDGEYPLWLGAQTALLSAPGSRLPAVDRKTLLALMGDDWAAVAASLGGLGVIGVLRPGVDGDVLGFLAWDAEFRAAFAGAMETAVTAAGFGWTKTFEADF